MIKGDDNLMTIQFIVHGKPQGKARPRFNKSTGCIYTPKETTNYERAIAAAYKRAANGYSFGDRAVKVVVNAFFVPAKTTKFKQPTIKPDIDNVVKAVLDGLNDVAYNDDKQVVDVVAVKSYSPFIPYIAVEVSEAADEE